MRAFALVVAAAACFALAVTSSALATGASATGAPASSQFQDPVGDAGTGPDITNIAVSNDTVGNVTFRIDIANRPTLTSVFQLDVRIDADSNSATGDPRDGTDYVVNFLAGATRLLSWNAPLSGYDVSEPDALTGVYSNGVTLTVDVADLGGITSFRFNVGVADNGDGTQVDLSDTDHAPLFGTFQYSVALGSIAAIVPPGSLLKTVKPGKTLVIRGFKLKLDDKNVIVPHGVSCALKIAGKLLPPTGPCKWKIPGTAAGKRLVLIVILTFGDDSMKQTYLGKVKT